MYSSDTQPEIRHGTLMPQSDIDASAYPNEYELEKQTLIAEIERIQHEQMITEIERLKIEEFKIELSQLKWCSLHKLQQSLNQQNFPSAIAYIDSLAQRLPDEPDVRHWQAIAYLQWGRHLSKQKDIKKAECCFNKAVSLVPKNSSLHSQVQQEISRLRGCL